MIFIRIMKEFPVMLRMVDVIAEYVLLMHNTIRRKQFVRLKKRGDYAVVAWFINRICNRKVHPPTISEVPSLGYKTVIFNFHYRNVIPEFFPVHGVFRLN